MGIKDLFGKKDKENKPEDSDKQLQDEKENDLESRIEDSNQDETSDQTLKDVEEPTPLFSVDNPDKINYHQSKDIIDKSIKDYSLDYEDKLPVPKFKIDNNKSSVSFGLSENINFYDLLFNSVSKSNTFDDKPKLRNFGTDTLYLEMNKNFSICFSNHKHFHWDEYKKSIEFTKQGDFTSSEIELIIETYRIGNPLAKEKHRATPQERLASLGIEIYEPDTRFGWDYLSGYEEVKQEIQDTIILSLKNPEIYDKIANGTRRVYESNKPKAILFEGPPGTGKTTTARIMAGDIDSHLIYVPIESIMTKWYGESERNLAYIFHAAKDLGQSILFLDEIDSLATSRDNNIHEATRRVLSVLLRHIDGFEQDDRTLIIGATNKKNDLDPALLSRFDLSINFPLPNESERYSIFSGYAKHLDTTNLEYLAKNSEGISGRNIKDICEHAERRHASNIIQNKTDLELPPLNLYRDTLELRKNNGI
ncbi:hypothetical protein C0585_07190 [Candidatus Woesearchaeota archaeon]|nr:MAG: hypothetical protein C0585_07190 [Candidatus Woesearchaeota archaeon]